MADDDADLDEAGLSEEVSIPGETEAEKRKRRQDRHRLLERHRRQKTQTLLNAIQVRCCFTFLAACAFVACILLLS